jgi:hypothetical protein
MLAVRRAAAPLLIALLGLSSCKTAEEPAPTKEKRTVEADTSKAEPNLTDFRKMDFEALPDDFAEAFKIIRKSQKWSSHSKHMGEGDAKADPRERMTLKMNRDLLEQASVAGCGFLSNWQLEEGNFRYMYDWMTKEWVDDDHQVRQAGSLWGIGTCYRYQPSAELKAVLDKGLKFWFAATIPGPEEGTLTMKYREDRTIHSGSVALVALAMVEYLKTDAPMDPAWKAEVEEKLDGYLKFLQWMQRDNGLISKEFDHVKNQRRERSSPYYDGESLLAMTKAARQLDKKWLVPTIEEAAFAMAEEYTLKAWPKDRDSKQTKGFFQWGSMSFAEYYQAKWKDYEVIGDVGLSLGWWMTHTHATLKRRRNHAYAVEGLIADWRIANWRGDVAAQTDLLYTLDRSLHKLSTWQIGGPLAPENEWLMANNTDDPLAQGGVMNAKKPSGAPVKKDVSHQLRIDVTQHQMHAVSMALDHVYPKQ